MTVSDPREAPQTKAPLVILWVLILLYATYFSALTFQRHAAFQTFAADLSFFDQPMWNTAHGRLLERTQGELQVSRAATHLEPVLIPLSLVLLVWDDVRALLLLQSVALALGALPVFLIARRVLRENKHAAWLALAFGAAYLLFPALQAANIADFHADPLIVAPFLAAFWFASQKRWAPMWACALVAMLTKENLPTVTAMLGLSLVVLDPEVRAAFAMQGSLRQRMRRALGAGALHGVLLILVSVAWWYIASFRIIGPLAERVYGTQGPFYLEGRFDAVASSPVNALVAVVRDPVRISYLVLLFAATGWLALLAPEYLLLGLPILIANLLSSFAGQYSGEQHYSAALVPAFMIAAIYGARRALRILEAWLPFKLLARMPASTLVAGVVALWMLGFSVGQQIERGWTPLSRLHRWPEVTAHNRLLARFEAQIPADASISTTPPLHPHLAHRERIYLFPTIAEADYVLVDVSGNTDRQPTDVKEVLDGLLEAGEYGVADAADGYLLLRRGGTERAIPDEFYTFVRSGQSEPQHRLDVDFEGALRLVGYDVVDDPRWRLTRLRFHWRVDGTVPSDTAVQYQVVTPWGSVADSSDTRPPPSLLWLPPEKWQPGDTIVIETVPWYLPRTWAPAVSVAAGGVPVEVRFDVAAEGQMQLALSPDGWLGLPAWARRDRLLVPFASPFDTAEAPVEEIAANFSDGGWVADLTAWAAPVAAAPGTDLPVSLRWTATGPAPTDYTIFLHLRDENGQTVANGDAGPTWFVAQPTSGWVAGGEEGGRWFSQSIALPAALQPGRYDLVMGWYDFRTGVRLALVGEVGNRLGDEFVLGPVTIDPGSRPAPDICCRYAPGCCASLE